jgi:anti-sigma factor ChrR (cupin superfamily)
MSQRSLHDLAEAWDPDSLESAVTPVEPPPELRARLMNQLAGYCATGPVLEVRHNEGEWHSVGVPGIDRRLLYVDPVTRYRTFHLRMAPGSTLPAHRHTTHEQCLVLEGDLQWDEQRYGPGDFVVAGADTIHSPIHSDGGALILIISG